VYHFGEHLYKKSQSSLQQRSKVTHKSLVDEYDLCTDFLLYTMSLLLMSTCLFTYLKITLMKISCLGSELTKKKTLDLY